MRHLLLLGALLAMQGAAARKPEAPCDLPCTVEQGKYIVVLETSAGPRRFVFDTGASRTTVSERLCREAGIVPAGQNTVGDFEGYRQRIAAARIPAITIGGTVFTECPADVLPDSSYVWCLGVDGIVGSDLLQHFVVRFCSDTTLLLARDYRQFGDLDPKQALRLRRADTRPFVPLHAGSGKKRLRLWALFDSAPRASSTAATASACSCSTAASSAACAARRATPDTWAGPTARPSAKPCAARSPGSNSPGVSCPKCPLGRPTAVAANSAANC